MRFKITTQTTLGFDSNLILEADVPGKFDTPDYILQTVYQTAKNLEAGRVLIFSVEDDPAA